MKNTNETESFELSWELPHAPRKVWRALTQSDLLAKWVMPNDLRPEVGHRFTFRTDPGHGWDGIVYGEVLEVVPPDRLKYSWKAFPRPEGAYALDTVVLWTLEPSGSRGTVLRLRQSGFTPENRLAYAGARAGWGGHVKRLGELLSATEDEPGA